MISREIMAHNATRAFVIEELLETIYEVVVKLDHETQTPDSPQSRMVGHLVYRVRHLLHGASGLAGTLAHDLSDSIGDCPPSDAKGGTK